MDGFSLFPFVESGSSDLYVIPRYKTAFLDPFSEIPTLNILCAYYDRDGKPVESAPEHILKKAHQAFKDKTGYSFEAMSGLEYYIISEDDGLFKAGSGLHIHSRVMKEGKNLMIKDGAYSFLLCCFRKNARKAKGDLHTVQCISQRNVKLPD